MTEGSRERDGRESPAVAWPEPERALEAGIDVDRANAARIDDYLLGGACNFAVDREQAAKILAQNPDMAYVCRANRDFLRRAVEWCLAAGITQFLDLGSGVPTVGNVHEIALAHRPDARVAYVDFEPVAVAHAHEVVDGLPTVGITRADMRDPDGVLGAPGVRDLLDPDLPTALLTVAVLHFVPDPALPAILARYRAALAPGSVHVMSHGSADHDDPDLAASTRAIGRLPRQRDGGRPALPRGDPRVPRRARAGRAAGPPRRHRRLARAQPGGAAHRRLRRDRPHPLSRSHGSISWRTPSAVPVTTIRPVLGSAATVLGWRTVGIRATSRGCGPLVSNPTTSLVAVSVTQSRSRVAS
ncbi:SAM-dependent methyltransferase [Actinomycetospora straminea]|uniref:SAM-dependent methyltransferase n=1 Tax=Actinomycetospora straminea TaxID=663607 RepID=UPI002365E93E|nr:SAM-dependent methyltransferase [Actinomycetospora straminea]MDD7936681.1 SAM-dependent methyltransferase [Actinomycetospora straminea]